MDNIESGITNYNHGISVVERKTIIITGVKKIDNFDSEEFLLETTMGYLTLKGRDLELVKLDTLQGNVSIKGLVNSFYYIDENNNKAKEHTIFNRLFK